MNKNNHLCPVCGEIKHKMLFSDRNRRDNIDYVGTYVQCVEGLLIYLYERPLWDDIVKFYSSLEVDQTTNTGRCSVDELLFQSNRLVPGWKQCLRKIRFRPHSWPLNAAGKEGKRILDLGCGNGTKLVEFSSRGYEIWGVDVGVDAIDICKKLFPLGHFIRGELQETGLPDAYFDYIRIDNALEHVPNPKEVIVECSRLLQEGGQVLVYVPHGRSLSMRFMKGNSISSWIPFHLQLFTRKSLRRLLKEAGFTDIKIYGYNPSSWLPLSFMQWRGRKKAAMNFKCAHWLMWFCYPLSWMAGKLGFEEELVAVGTVRKNYK